MKRLAWWAVGSGLALKLADFIPPAFDMDYTDSWALVPRVFSSFGYVLFMGGAIVLGATVIADAITKAQGAREGP